MSAARSIFTAILFTLLATLQTELVPGAELPESRPEDVGFDPAKLAEISNVMKNLVDSGQVAGLTTIVARRGKVAFFESTGKADVATERPMARDTIVRIYSMSKPVTSVAIMMLVEEGRLALDDPLAKHLPEFENIQVLRDESAETPEFAPADRQPTIRDLLRHTAGFTYGFFSRTPIDRRYFLSELLINYDRPLSDLVSRLGEIPLLYQPGTRFHYSIASDVLGRVVEVASDKSFDEFLSERVFKPLDMRDTGFFVPEEKHDRFAANYTTKLGRLVEQEAAQGSPFQKRRVLLSGGGGLVSTARDYLRFCQMMLNHGELDGQRLLSQQSVAEMTRNQLSGAQYPISIGGFRRPGVGFGLGFSVINEQIPFASFVPVGEYGWGGAASTHFWISPKHETAVVILSQYMPFSLRLEAAIKPIVYGAMSDVAE